MPSYKRNDRRRKIIKAEKEKTKCALKEIERLKVEVRKLQSQLKTICFPECSFFCNILSILS